MHGWASEVIGAIGIPNTNPEAYLEVFFTQSASSRQAGQEALRRMYPRTKDRDTTTTWATRQAQYDAVCTWGIPNHALLQRLSALGRPVFVANGDSDPMILPTTPTARRPDPARPGEDLPRLRPRVLVPASRRIRRRRRGIPRPRQLRTRQSHRNAHPPLLSQRPEVGLRSHVGLPWLVH